MIPQAHDGAIPIPDGARFYLDRSSIELLFAHLADAGVSLELVQLDGSGRLYLSFQLLAPLAGYDRVVSVGFLAQNVQRASLSALSVGLSTTTPFEALRGLERQGAEFQLLGVSDALRARDAAIHAERFGASDDEINQANTD